ncbi:hypothetical protein JDW15_10300 [Aerococcaceae bacterium zg-ZJ1578]|uniref:spr1630 family ClpXP-sensitive toxin n=1 Tax=Aerococcaceae bacterium zg-252 TaxID=2796928 RepID=UPI001A19CC8D|nr:hypothetical protein [Aerococcaceae bacterium zg-1578]
MTNIIDACMGQKIVDAIVQGYAEYLQVRIEKNKVMTVSGGYAFTRGNHIDDALSKAQIFDEFKLSRAGHSWEYLQFPLTINNQKCLLITKNLTRLENNMKQGKKDNYLIEFAKMNDQWISSEDEIQQAPIQLQLFSEREAEEVKERVVNDEYERFYVLSYQIDSVTKHIVSVELIMPLSNGSLICMQDLSQYLNTTNVTIESNAYFPILDEKDDTEYEEYEYAVRVTEQEKTNE